MKGYSMNKTTKTLVIALVILFLFWNPMTRAVILFILPLGSGVDDLVMIAAAIVALAVWGIKKLKEKN